MTRFGFYLLVFSLGALALVGQVLLLRQFMVAFYGSELVIAVVLAAWLSGVFLGARAFGLFSLPAHRLGLWLAVLPLVWIVVLAGLITLTFFINGLMGLAPGEAVPVSLILLWAALLTTPAGFFVGGLFVLAGAYLDVNLEGGVSKNQAGPLVFWAESTGSTVGLLAYTFFLVGRAGPFETLGLFAALVFLGQALTLPRLITNRILLCVGILGLAASIHALGLGTKLDDAAGRARFQQAHPGYELLEMTDTPYQHLTLAVRGGETVLFGNQQYVASWPDPQKYEVLTLFFLTEARRYDRVLLAGQGPGGFIQEFLKHPLKELVYLDLDPAEIEVTVRHLSPELVQALDDSRLKIVHDDPRRFLNRTAGQFDLVVINAPDPDSAQINRLYTLEFFRSVKKRLTPEGVLAVSVTGAENYWGRELLSFGRSLYLTLKEVFPEVVVTPGDTHYFLAGASPGLVTDDPEKLAVRYKERGFESPYMTPRSMLIFFHPTGLEYIKQRLSTDKPGRLNTDVAPLSYFLRLIWWEQMTGSRVVKSLLSRAAHIETWGFWALAGLVPALMVLVIRPRPCRTARWTMTSSGAASMALQIILIFLFQNYYGVIYRDIGLLSALFMAGLAIGGGSGRLAVRQGLGGPRLLGGLEVILALTAGLTAWTAGGNRPELILPLVGASGLIVGLEFALLYDYYLSDPQNPPVGEALSALESADHGGAVVGALITGLILAPVAGLKLTAAVLAGFKLASGLLIWGVRPRD